MDELIKMMQELKADMNKKFTSIDSQFLQMEKNITTKITEHFDTKFQEMNNDLGKLRNKLQEQEKRLYVLEKNSVKRNLVFFGIDEKEKHYIQLQKQIFEIITNIVKVEIQETELQSIRRMGKKGDRPRPISVTLSTLTNEMRIIELEYAISQIKWDIIGLAEVRREGYRIEDRGSYLLYYFGKTKGEKGVGFLVKKQRGTEVHDFIALSERVALLQVNIYGTMFSLIQVYAPTTAASEAEIENMYNDLDEAISKCTKNIIFMGDMNAKIGKPECHERLVMGDYGYGNRNCRGKMFIHFCLQNKLKIVNTMFKKPKKLRWTWMSPDGKSMNEIDFIATNIPKNVQNLNVINKTGGIKKAYREIDNTKQLMTQLFNSSGTIVTHRRDLMEVTTNFYKDLYRNVNKTEEIPLHKIHNNDSVPQIIEKRNGDLVKLKS
ncbi:unnamed protein product [Euphydryas editha]|uniref:Endonuclease/exonuclease/phosphatase domain-containing protein n=1 Tax=Euphydryas editha TaxID=104508 RepID=A0AAU9UJZ5_EUPED|nr:unnamed protein product [Euphydryas editha]